MLKIVRDMYICTEKCVGATLYGVIAVEDMEEIGTVGQDFLGYRR